MEKNRICKYCNVEFENIEGRVFSNHVRWCDRNDSNGDKGSKIISEKALDRYTKLYGAFENFNVNCINCERELEVRERSELFPKKEKYYCNRSCANTRTHSEETKEKIRIKSRKNWTDESYVKMMMENNVDKNPIFSSKGEREVSDYIKQELGGDWTTGCIHYDNEIIQRDLYSDGLRICFEYDGAWHFEDIHGQLEKKQRKDKLLEKWCVGNGYRLIRIKESVYKSNRNYWKEKILKEIKKGFNKIVKFY